VFGANLSFLVVRRWCVFVCFRSRRLHILVEKH